MQTTFSLRTNETETPPVLGNAAYVRYPSGIPGCIKVSEKGHEARAGKVRTDLYRMTKKGEKGLQIGQEGGTIM
jgi:hypothetical protein